MKSGQSLLIKRVLKTIPLTGNPGGYAAAWAIDGAKPRDVAFLDELSEAPRTPPAPGALRLWAGAPRASTTDLFDACADILVPEEVERARKFRQERDVRSFLAGHAVVRLMLAAALSCAPRALRFTLGSHGKPTLTAVGDRTAPADMHFNLSHTDDRLLVGLASSPLGVDIEAICAFPDEYSIAHLVFAHESLVAFAAARDSEEKKKLFYRFWVLGEAYIKATGLGMTQSFRSFAFTPNGAPRLTLATPGWGPPERWSFGLLSEVPTAAADAG